MILKNLPKILFQNNSIKFRYNCDMKSIPDIIEKWSRKFQEVKIESFDFELKCITAHVLNKKFNDSFDYKNTRFSKEQLSQFERLCECRLSRMPLQYIIGEWDFQDITLKMLPPVFIPRPETENLITLILENVDTNKEYNFLEIGCGSGAISLSILSKLINSKCIALDRSKLACNLTMENAQNLNLSKRIEIINYLVENEKNLPEKIQKSYFDMIVSNPPYIKTKDLKNLPPEILLYENLTALDGGPDGLNVVKNICNVANNYLKTNGKLWMEIDPQQIPAIEDYIKLNFNSMLKFVNYHKDMFEKDRFVEILKLN